MIPTGVPDLDEILGGGLAECQITCVYGSSGTGKTQLLMQAAATSAASGKRVLFQDSTDTFRPERLGEMLAARGQREMLRNIQVSRVRSAAEQRRSLERIDAKNYDLILADNITDLFSFEYPHLSQFREKITLLAKYMRGLAEIALKNRIPIFVSNITRVVDGREEQSGRDALDAFIHSRIRLRRATESSYEAEVESIPATGRFRYSITASGIGEPENR